MQMGKMSFGQEWWKKFHEPQLACENHKIKVLAKFLLCGMILLVPKL